MQRKHGCGWPGVDLYLELQQPVASAAAEPSVDVVSRWAPVQAHCINQSTVSFNDGVLSNVLCWASVGSLSRSKDHRRQSNNWSAAGRQRERERGEEGDWPAPVEPAWGTRVMATSSLFSCFTSRQWMLLHGVTPINITTTQSALIIMYAQGKKEGSIEDKEEAKADGGTQRREAEKLGGVHPPHRSNSTSCLLT